ncbi:MAG: hypothetical protein ABI706_20755 [Ilumatobacteraceae bacterium]
MRALVGFLVIPPVARLLDHAMPPVAGLVVAAMAEPFVLAVDAAHKRARRRLRLPRVP